jgi:hypothetical protein
LSGLCDFGRVTPEVNLVGEIDIGEMYVFWRRTWLEINGIEINSFFKSAVEISHPLTTWNHMLSNPSVAEDCLRQQNKVQREIGRGWRIVSF